MGRNVPFNKDAVCDECGATGAYDFMGDLLCQECSDKFMAEDFEAMSKRTMTNGPCVGD